MALFGCIPGLWIVLNSFHAVGWHAAVSWVTAACSGLSLHPITFLRQDSGPVTLSPTVPSRGQKRKCKTEMCLFVKERCCAHYDNSLRYIAKFKAPKVLYSGRRPHKLPPTCVYMLTNLARTQRLWSIDMSSSAIITNLSFFQMSHSITMEPLQVRN